jgi:MoaD family protein
VPMKITIAPYLTFRRYIGGRSSLDIDFKGGDVQALLQELCARFGDEFRAAIFDAETGEVNSRIALLINGRYVSHLPKGLGTELAEGDELAIFPPVMGGKV